MNERLNEVLLSYTETFERKERMIKRIQEKKKVTEISLSEQLNLTVLESECRLLRSLIEDLEYIREK